MYSEHLRANGQADVAVDTVDSGRYVVAAGKDCVSQLLAYREQAKTAMKNLVAQLARDRTELSTEASITPVAVVLSCGLQIFLTTSMSSCARLQQNKEEICFQHQLLEDIDRRIASLGIAG